jgi:hypothetical protein
MRLYFNFAFGELSHKGGGEFGYVSQKGRRYDVRVKASKDVDFEILKGSEEPIGGWISYGYAWRKAIPQLAVKTNGPVPVRFVTVMGPEGCEARVLVTLEEVKVELAGGRVLIMGEDEVRIEE